MVYPGAVLLLLGVGFLLIVVGAFILVNDLITTGSAEIDSIGLVLLGCLSVGIGLLSHRNSSGSGGLREIHR